MKYKTYYSIQSGLIFNKLTTTKLMKKVNDSIFIVDSFPGLIHEWTDPFPGLIHEWANPP